MEYDAVNKIYLVEERHENTTKKIKKKYECEYEYEYAYVCMYKC